MGLAYIVYEQSGGLHIDNPKVPESDTFLTAVMPTLFYLYR